MPPTETNKNLPQSFSDWRPSTLLNTLQIEAKCGNIISRWSRGCWKASSIRIIWLKTGDTPRSFLQISTEEPQSVCHSLRTLCIPQDDRTFPSLSPNPDSWVNPLWHLLSLQRIDSPLDTREAQSILWSALSTCRVTEILCPLVCWHIPLRLHCHLPMEPCDSTDAPGRQEKLKGWLSSLRYWYTNCLILCPGTFGYFKALLH